MASVHVYTPHTGRTGYSVASDDGKRVYLVTPEAGPGKLSPVVGWIVWKSDSTRTIRRFPNSEAGCSKAIELAKKLAEQV